MIIILEVIIVILNNILTRTLFLTCLIFNYIGDTELIQDREYSLVYEYLNVYKLCEERILENGL